MQALGLAFAASLRRLHEGLLSKQGQASFAMIQCCRTN